MHTVKSDGERVKSLRDMPQELQPGRDLWAGIESRITVRRRTWQLPASLAAGVVLLATGISIGVHLRQADPQTTATASGNLLQAAFWSDSDYQRQRDALLRALPEKLEQLPPESRQHVQDSLQSIQQAIQDIQTELGRDASNVLLQELLINATQEEMRVLTAVDTANGINGRT